MSEKYHKENKVDNNKCHVCPWRMAYLFDNPIRKLFHNPEKIFGRYLKKNSVNVDIGCGMGYFSIGMASITDSESRVIAVDLQTEMLEVMKKRASKAGILNKIIPVKADPQDFRIPEKADFMLMFWVLHETPDMKQSLQQLYNNLKPDGRLMIVEPGMHVSDKMVEEELELAKQIGFKLVEKPEVKLSKALVLSR